MYTKEIQVIDAAGTPLKGAHVITPVESSTTNSNGQAAVKVQNQQDIVTISHVSGEKKDIAFFELAGPVTLGENSLEEVVITAPKKKSSLWLWVPMIAMAGLMIMSSNEKPKKVIL